MEGIIKEVTSLFKTIGTDNEIFVKAIIALSVFVVMLLFKNYISKGISFLLCKIFFRKSQNAQRKVTESIYRPLSYFVAVLGAYIAIELIFPSGSLHSKATVVLKLCFICLSAWFGVNFINGNYNVVIANELSNSRKTALKFINNILNIAIVTIAALLMLEQFGISASKLFAALGIGGIAVAFACKDIVENMLSGFIIIFDKPFEVGDFIEIKGEYGTVVDIKIRTTRITGVDGCEKVFPNTTMANSSITNWSKMEKRAINETISVTYATAGEKMNTICDGIRNVILANESVVPDDVRVNFTNFGNHALEISTFFYVTQTTAPEYFAVKNDINVALKKYFDESGVELAFESKTLYFGDELKIQK